MKLPKEGDFITIQSYKHDGSLHRTWRDTMVLKTTENAIIGVNDHTLVTESDGRRWVTREPAIVYFHKKYWLSGNFWLLSFKISYLCLPLFHETRTTPSCHPSGCAYRQL